MLEKTWDLSVVLKDMTAEWETMIWYFWKCVGVKKEKERSPYDFVLTDGMHSTLSFITDEPVRINLNSVAIVLMLLSLPDFNELYGRQRQ